MPRMVVVWCPDWPVAAAGAPPDSLTAVLHANRVVACSPAARAEGVHPGLRRREAQSRCPELELLAHDPARDARAFEPVLVAVEQLTPWVEVLHPGACAFPARGAARYHGGEPSLVATLTAAVHAGLGGRGACRVGIADGTFAAGLAARRAGAEGGLSQAGLVGRHGVIVPPGGSRAFLAQHPMTTLDRPDLADLLVRLGLRTLGDLAALPGADLAARFGPEGARRPPTDLRVSAELAPPADRVDIAAFTAKALADELVARLDRLGLACTRLRIEAETDQAETLSRVWRYDPTTLLPRLPSPPDPVPCSPSYGGGGGPRSRGPMDPPARMAAVMAERVRWQLDGWLTGRTGSPPGALTHLTLVPDEVVPHQGRGPHPGSPRPRSRPDRPPPRRPRPRHPCHPHPGNRIRGSARPRSQGAERCRKARRTPRAGSRWVGGRQEPSSVEPREGRSEKARSRRAPHPPGSRPLGSSRSPSRPTRLARFPSRAHRPPDPRPASLLAPGPRAASPLAPGTHRGLAPPRAGDGAVAGAGASPRPGDRLRRAASGGGGGRRRRNRRRRRTRPARLVPEPGPGPGPRLVGHHRLGRPLAGRRALVGPGRPSPPGPPPGDHRPGRRLPAPAGRRPLVGRGDLRLRWLPGAVDSHLRPPHPGRRTAPPPAH